MHKPLGKRERHLSDLRIFPECNSGMTSYLLEHSNLPGKRGNIELGFAFADYVEKVYPQDRKRFFMQCRTMISENPPEKQRIGNEEFLPFCAVIALGRIGKIDTTKEDAVIGILKVAAQDNRWRIREGVAMAIQELMDVHPKATLEKLQVWAYADSYLIQRALVAGLAEPRLLKNRETARASLEIHKIILENVAKEPETRDKDFQVLVQGLCYTLSVTITGIEDEGFAYLETLSKTEHPIIKKIVRENLKKNRLKRLNADKVVELEGLTRK